MPRNPRPRRTWTTTTTVIAALRNHRHYTRTLRADEKLDEYVARLSNEYGPELVRVSYMTTTICNETREIAEVTTSWFTDGEVVEAVQKLARFVGIRDQHAPVRT